MITLHYDIATTPGNAILMWTDGRKSLSVTVRSGETNPGVIAMRPAGVREREWALAVSAAADRGARGETGRIAVEVRA